MKPLLILSALLLTTAATAQELNLGVHLNPIVTTPFLDGASQADSRINVSKARLGVSLGVDANVVMGKWRLQTAGNLMHKSVSYNQRTLGGSSLVYSKDIIESTSVEVPLLLGYRLATRNRHTYYHVYGVAGVSYEWNTIGAVSSKSGASGSGGTASIANYDTELIGGSSQWINLVAGVNFNAILRGVGLIDYGLTYHLPMGNSGGYTVSQDINVGSGNINYKGTYYPRMAYINFKLCYYFLSLRDGGIKRYSKV